eukprot:XP_025012181.1 uncharacterized protein LOC112533940 [Ricinus communis]
MCKNPLSPSMASSLENPNHDIKVSSPKRLNPHASPFQILDSNSPPLSPAKSCLFLPLRPFFPHEYRFRPPLPQMLSVVQPLPVSPPPHPGVVCYPVPRPHHLHHNLPTPSWAYPAVYYNTHKQPLPAANTVPYYVEHVSKESSMYHTNTQPVGMGNLERNNPNYGHDEKRFHAVQMGDMNNFGVLGCKEKREKTRAVKKSEAPRMRSKRKEKLGYPCFGELWVPKGIASNKKNGGGGSGSKFGKKTDGVLHPPVSDAINLEENTSLMIRNIPNQFERNKLMDILDRHCQEENEKAELRSDPIKSEYDFLYLPMDFKSRANFGYAFVNFTNSAGAARFAKRFQKHKWDVMLNKKTCEICCAKIQGKNALRNHFKNSVFPCHTNGYLPVVFSPPRGGPVSSEPIVVGKCGVAAVDQRK